MDIKAITGLSLSEEQLDQATRRLTFFAPSGANEYVNELFEFLILQALAGMEEGHWLGHEIHAKVRKMTGIQIEFEEVLSGLSRLARKETITCFAFPSNNAFAEGARFSLSPAFRDSWRDKYRAQVDFERKVIDAWKEEAQTLFPDVTAIELDQLEKDLRIYAFRLLSYNSVESLVLYYGGSSNVDELAAALETENMSEILPGSDLRLKRMRGELLPKFFKTQDISRRKYIFDLLQSVFILHMIQLDSSCSQLVKPQLLGGTLYLDTNFLFRLFGLHSPDMFFASKTLVSISQDANYRLVVTPRTLEEYEYALRNYMNNLVSAPKLPRDLMEQVIEMSDSEEDPVIAYYRNMASSRTKITASGVYVDPRAYHEYFSEAPALLEPYGIEVDEEECDAIREADAELAAEASRLKSFIDSRLERSSFGDQGVNPHVAEHDAFHRLLVLRRRAGSGKPSFFEVPYWFLTCDSRLPAYDRTRRVSENIDTPFCVFSAHWLQTLRPFAPRVDADALIPSLSSPLLRMYSAIPNSIITDVASRLAMHQHYNPAVGKHAMKRQFLLQFAQAQTEEEKEELIESQLLEYATMVEEKYDELEGKYKESETSRHKLQTYAQKLEGRISTLEEKIEKDRNQTEELLSKQNERFEQDRKEHSEQIKRLVSELGESKSNENRSAQELEYERRRREQLERGFFVVGLVVAYALALFGFRPWETGGLSWLIFPVLMVLIYIIIMFYFQPWGNGRWGKVFSILLPIIIFLSLGLPLGGGYEVVTILGLVSNVGGVFSFLWILLKADKNDS